jgi:hypothetical protein
LLHLLLLLLLLLLLAAVLQTFANTWLLSDALLDLEFSNPALRERRDLGRSSFSSTLRCNEDPGATDGTQLLGKGRRPKRAAKQMLEDAVVALVGNHSGLSGGWSAALVMSAFKQKGSGKGVYTFLRCDKPGCEQASTDSYGRAVTNQNYIVKLQQPGQNAVRVGVVKHLLWVRHPDNAAWEGMVIGHQVSGDVQSELDRDLRIALVEEYCGVSLTPGSSNMLHVPDMDNVTAVQGMPLSHLERKLVKFEPGGGSNELWFEVYTNMSKLHS